MKRSTRLHRKIGSSIVNAGKHGVRNVESADNSQPSASSSLVDIEEAVDSQTRPPPSTPAPSFWQDVLFNIRKMRASKNAPVDSMGCEKCGDKDGDQKLFRLQTLVSLLLSSQTKDEINFAAMTRLKSRNLSVDMLLTIPEPELAQLLLPVGFYKRKAGYLKKTAEVLRNQYEDDIPSTIEELCNLPGVGPKMAHICMRVAWGKICGIGVDTHVHRITNRLGWVRTKTPEDTRKALEAWLPREIWGEINELLVGFGQQVCQPVKPKCQDSLVKNLCLYGKKQ